ncbi:hypothetical protein AM499_02250 [Bacillus sp. FJAT-22090]|uniref:hypothetical protein n=1 Tax=Bacillus sp. FJAT-22090 TaxID=1581038 RepID=UPI0006AFB853|nr:hypothetical protein [Bacillus sp. FJAT-22090]ALC84767.1 hypothetical protein AM499_02250 [Bacillus sp. FJAT-22090]
MKKDFRVQYPLWQMGFALLFLLFAIVITGAISNFAKANRSFNYSVELGALEGFMVFLLLPVYIGMVLLFGTKISKYNKEHPRNKITIWGIKPVEYMEDDEAWQMITTKATQKVYTFFSWSLPLSAVIHLFLPASQLLIILNIIVLSMTQYIIYYVNIRKHTMEEEEV